MLETGATVTEPSILNVPGVAMDRRHERQTKATM